MTSSFRHKSRAVLQFSALSLSCDVCLSTVEVMGGTPCSCLPVADAFEVLEGVIAE